MRPVSRNGGEEAVVAAKSTEAAPGVTAAAIWLKLGLGPDTDAPPVRLSRFW